MSKICIFSKTEVLAVLKNINTEYKVLYFQDTPKSARLMKTYSKIAVIELCGWIEDGLKNLAKLSIEKLKVRRVRKDVNNFIEGINGFKYDSHFSKIMMLAFGAHGFEFIESRVGDADIARLRSVLGNLKNWRDDSAHSHIITIPCDPSHIIKEMDIIFPILKKIEINARIYKKKHFKSNK